MQNATLNNNYIKTLSLKLTLKVTALQNNAIVFIIYSGTSVLVPTYMHFC
jgi:hypothetical protein